MDLLPPPLFTTLSVVQFSSSLPDCRPRRTMRTCLLFGWVIALFLGLASSPLGGLTLSLIISQTSRRRRRLGQYSFLSPLPSPFSPNGRKIRLCEPVFQVGIPRFPSFPDIPNSRSMNWNFLPPFIARRPDHPPFLSTAPPPWYIRGFQPLSVFRFSSHGS